MNHQSLLIDMIYFISTKELLLDMTVNNPIFIFALITVIWFLPGIIVRRINETKMIYKKNKLQKDAIEKLYPKSKD